MTPLLLISAVVTSYMCLVEGPCREMHRWMKDERGEMSRFTFNETMNEIREKLKEYRESQCSCIIVDECPSIAALVRNPSRTEAETQAVQSARCGWDGSGRPKVSCCDKICYTPEGLPGRCADYKVCPHLSALVNKTPIPEADLKYLQQSTCQGPGRYNLCCGPPRGTAPREPQQCPPSAAIPDKNSECCGRDANNENRIIGGNATAVDQYPWLALIEYRGYDRTIKLMCGAVLISSRYVLTAGHCIKGVVRSHGTPVNIRLGEYDTANDGPDCVPVEARGKDCSEGTVTIPIEQLIPHPEYRPERSKNNDIGLIRMRQLAPFTEFIRPICLPTEDITLNPPADLRLFVAGWGAINNKISKSNVKLHVDVPYVPLVTCQKAYTPASRRAQLVRQQICAGGEPKKDSCRGDSGGPLMYENEETRLFEVTGIVSFGSTPCGLENVPGVYTNVFQYDSWIRSQIQP